MASGIGVSTREFSGKSVFITGAGSGIGYQIALAFAREGADIVATDVSPEGLARLAPEVERQGVKYRSEILNVADEQAFRELADQLAAENALPDNQGVGQRRDGSLQQGKALAELTHAVPSDVPGDFTRPDRDGFARIGQRQGQRISKGLFDNGTTIRRAISIIEVLAAAWADLQRKPGPSDPESPNAQIV